MNSLKLIIDYGNGLTDPVTSLELEDEALGIVRSVQLNNPDPRPLLVIDFVVDTAAKQAQLAVLRNVAGLMIRATFVNAGNVVVPEPEFVPAS